MRWLFRAAIFLFVLLPLGLAAAFLALFTEDAPLVPPQPAPSPQDVKITRGFVHQVRGRGVENRDDGHDVSLTAEELNAVIRFGARFVRGARGVARVEDGRVIGEASLPLPWPLRGKWLNGAAVAPPFDGVLKLDSLTVGGVALPPDLSVEAGRILANLVMGGARGDKMLRSAEAMSIDGDRLTFAMRLDDDDRGSVMRGIFGALRGDEMPDAEEIDRYYVKIRSAMEAGELKEAGSFLPYLLFTLDAALAAGRDGDLANEYTAAVFGLAKVCGARDFGLVVGRLAVGDAQQFGEWSRSCESVTFNDRIDSRRHFITAAAIKAATNRGVAITVGEFKELLDSISAGGFDFTDIAANNSGIRMSDLLMARPAEDWPELLGRIRRENDVIVPLDGIPGLMPKQEFEVRFGDMESDAFYAMLAKIEEKIDRIALHRPP